MHTQTGALLSRLRGILTDVPVSLEDQVSSLNFLVLEETPVDVIIGVTALESLHATLDLRSQSVRMTINRKDDQ